MEQPKTITRYFVISVEFDKKLQKYEIGKISGYFNDNGLAYECILNAMQAYIDSHTDPDGKCPYRRDEFNTRVISDDDTHGKTWKIEKCVIELTEDEI